MYWLDPDGGNSSNAFLAYRDMTSYNGGWTMCYTSDEYAKPKSEVTYNPDFPYGVDGYRTNCNNISVSWIFPRQKWPLPQKVRSWRVLPSYVQWNLSTAPLSYRPRFYAAQSGVRCNEALVKVVTHRLVEVTSMRLLQRTGSSVGWASGYRAGGREFDSGRTNNQGLTNNWAAFVITSANASDFQVFSDKDYKSEVPSHNPCCKWLWVAKEPIHGHSWPFGGSQEAPFGRSRWAAPFVIQPSGCK